MLASVLTEVPVLMPVLVQMVMPALVPMLAVKVVLVPI